MNNKIIDTKTKLFWVIFSIITCIIVVFIFIYKPTNTTVKKSDIIISEEVQKTIQSADLETINKLSLQQKNILKEKTDNLAKTRSTIKGNKNLSLKEKTNELKKYQEQYNIEKKTIEEELKIIAKRKNELEISSNIKNLQNFIKMDETQLIKEVSDYFSGKYTYYKYEKPCKPEEIQKEFISLSISKNYPKLLDEVITKYSEKQQLHKDKEYYFSAYYSLWINHTDCFDVFLKHRIDLKKVNDRNNNDEGIINLAAAKGNTKAVKEALNQGIPIDQRNNSNITPLYQSIKNNKYETVEFLVNNGALAKGRLEEYNNYGNILYYPVKNKNLEMLDLLVKNGILIDDNLRLYTNNRDILRFIVSKGKINNNNNNKANSQDKEWEEAYKSIIKGDLDQLIKIENEGKDLSKMYYDGEPAICIAVENDKTKIIEYLIKKYDCRKLVDSINGRNALHYAAMGNSYNNLKILLENGFEPNALDNDNNTPLNLALCNNYMMFEFVKILLEKGANPNILNKNNQNSLFFIIDLMYMQSYKPILDNKSIDINHQDSVGNTPLHNFLLKSPERRKYIYSLLEKGANINLVNHKKQTPLHLAILSNDTNAVSQLISKNKNPDLSQQDIDGNTPLHYVALYAPNENMLKQIRRIHLYKTGFIFINNKGETPLDIGEPNCFNQPESFKKALKEE